MDLEDAYDKFAIYDKVDNGSGGEEQQPELDPNVNYNEVTDEEPSEEESSEDSSDDFSRMNHQKETKTEPRWEIIQSSSTCLWLFFRGSDDEEDDADNDK